MQLEFSVIDGGSSILTSSKLTVALLTPVQTDNADVAPINQRKLLILVG